MEGELAATFDARMPGDAEYNSRVRAMFVEMVWRMMRWQPGYHGLKKWMGVLSDPARNAAARM